MLPVSGRTRVTTQLRGVTLSNPLNPTTLTAWSETHSVNGRATVHLDDALIASKFGAQIIVRVVPEHIFPNCPRYIPNLSNGQASPYTPCEGVAPLEPAWKGFDAFKDVVPPRAR